MSEEHGRRAIVLIEWGPRRWQKALIAPGERLRVGRHERAELVMPHDQEMSGLHFELTWDGARCSLRDLSTPSGTILNGERVLAGEVGHGDWIQAGDTVLSVYHEGALPRWTPPAGAAALPPERRAEALATLRAAGPPLYAVLDAARSDRIAALLRSSPEQAQSLYDGPEGEALEEVAPFLVSLPRDGWLLARLVDEGWGEGWGIYVLCRRPFGEVRRQLRRNLIAEGDEEEERFYCRFYDPRALAKIVPRLGERRRRQFFGDVEAFLAEDSAGQVIRLDAGA